VRACSEPARKCVDIREPFTALHVSAVDFGIIDGLRTREEQAEYVRRGASRTMNSKHLKQASSCYGQAVDAVAWINRKYRWEPEPLLKVATAFLRAAAADKIRWGGCWRYLSEVEDPRAAVEAYVDNCDALSDNRR